MLSERLEKHKIKQTKNTKEQKSKKKQKHRKTQEQKNKPDIFRYKEQP